jgi:hypothetical protein
MQEFRTAIGALWKSAQKSNLPLENRLVSVDKLPD